MWELVLLVGLASALRREFSSQIQTKVPTVLAIISLGTLYRNILLRYVWDLSVMKCSVCKDSFIQSYSDTLEGREVWG